MKSDTQKQIKWNIALWTVTYLILKNRQLKNTNNNHDLRYMIIYINIFFLYF